MRIVVTSRLDGARFPVRPHKNGWKMRIREWDLAFDNLAALFDYLNRNRLLNVSFR